MELNVENVFNLVTVISTIFATIIAVIALIQTGVQIKLNNKQYLFDKRVENYIIVKGLLELYRKNKEQIENIKREEPCFFVDSIFAWLTNNTYLESITRVIDNPLENPNHRAFLIKMEELKQVSIKMKFLFDIKKLNKIEEYIKCYQELLLELYQYKIVLNHMENSIEKSMKSLEEAAKNVNEENYRNNLCDKIEKIKEIYIDIEKSNLEKIIDKEIKLK